MVIFSNNQQPEVIVTLVTLNEGNQIILTASGQDDSGNPKPLDTVDWTMDMDGIIALSPGPDAFSCVADFVTEGLVTITALGDADMTPPGQTLVTGTIQVQALAKAKATQVVITAGPETPVVRGRRAHGKWRFVP